MRANVPRSRMTSTFNGTRMYRLMPSATQMATRIPVYTNTRGRNARRIICWVDHPLLTPFWVEYLTNPLG